MTQALERCRNIADLRLLAKRRVPRPIFHFVDGGAEDEVTLRRNTDAFEEFELETEYAVDVSQIDPSTTLMGQKLDWPVILSPAGSTGLLHPQSELCSARAAGRAGTMFMLSCMANNSIEDVGAAGGGPKVLQAYTFRDRSLTREFIARAKASGYTALCLTFDVPVIGMRERDLATGMTIPPKLTLASLFDFALKPAWVARYFASPRLSIANIEHKIDEGSKDISTILKFVNNQFDPSATWADAAEMIAEWDGPAMIKGVMTAADAQRSLDVGATAVMVSNHGGRQLDGAPAAIDRLETVVEAVDGKAEVVLDGGVRRGSHVLKALALGAKACSVGRPYLYGRGAGGEAGVDRALTILREQVERSMALTGFATIADITRDRVSVRGQTHS